MDLLKAEIAKKRQRLEEDTGGKRFFKRSEIEQKQIQKLREQEKRDLEAKAQRQAATFNFKLSSSKLSVRSKPSLRGSLVVRCSQSDGNGGSVKRTYLHDLYEKEGQSPWYDNLCRPVTDLLPLIASGDRGVTSNPAIFQKVLSASNQEFSRTQHKCCLHGEAGNCSHSDFVASEGRGLKMEVSAGFNINVSSQPLAPIGTPAVKSDPQADIRSHTIGSLNTSSLPVVSGSMKNLGRGSIVDNKSKVLDDVQASLGLWGNSQINQRVLSLTQTQLNEAMKPGQFVSHGSVGEITSSVCESSMLSSSLLTKGNPFSYAANPINSLLAAKTNDLAGDGTTTSVVLAQGLIAEGVKVVAAGANPVLITRGIEKTTRALINELKLISKEVEDSELANVAAISAGSNYEVGNMIAEALSKVGKKGVVTLEEGKSVENSLYVVEGMQFDRGYISP